VSILTPARSSGYRDERSFLLQRAQPAMTGLIDGSLSTLAPIFAVALPPTSRGTPSSPG
jgi:erythrin-vacuolar iron transport family protein